MPTTRKFSAIRIELDLYYIDIWDSTRTIIYLNNEIIYNKEMKSKGSPIDVVYC